MQVAQTAHGSGGKSSKKKVKSAVQDRNPERKSISVQDRNPERVIQPDTSIFQRTLFTLNPSATADREQTPFALVDAAYESANGKSSPLAQVSRDAKDAKAAQNGQNLDEVIAAAQRGESVRPSGWSDYESGVQSWGQEVQDAVAQAQKSIEARDGVWQDSDALSGYRRQQNASLTRLLQRSQEYQDFFNGHRDVYGDRAVDDILAGLDEGRRALNSVGASLSEDERFRGQFSNQEEYDSYHRMSGYEALTGAKDFAEKSGYNSTYQPGKEYFSRVDDMWYDTGYGDILYDFINRNPDAMNKYMSTRDWNNLAGVGMAQTQLQEMTDGEIALFNYLYAQDEAKGDSTHAGAYQYIRDLNSGLNARQRQQAEAQAARFAREHPVVSSIGSVLASPMRGVSYLGQAADYLADGEIDQNAGYNQFAYIPNAIRGQVSQDVEKYWVDRGHEFGGKTASFLYNTGMSMGDFLLNTGITGGSQALTLGIMGTGAAADGVISAKDRGLSDNQAFALGTVAGLAEVATEKVSLEALLKPDWEKGVLNYVIKNAVAEGSEEVASDAINLLADVLISRDKSEWAQSVRAYMAAGYSEAEATGLAVKDQILSAGVDFLGGALSGGIMSGVSGVGHVMTNYQGGNQSEVTAPAGGEAGQTGSEILEQAAREMVGVERTGPVQQESNVRQESPRPSVRTGAPPFDKGGEGQVRQRTEAMQNASALVRASEAFGENGRKAFASAWDGQQSADRYYAGFSTWYQAGLTGKAQNQVRGPYAGTISEDQRFAAYAAGQNDAAASLEREKTAAPYARTAGGEAGLYNAGDMDADTAVRMDAAAKLLGVRVSLVDDVAEGRANGQYSGSDILIARNAEDPVGQVYGHELTHRVQELAPEQYRVFRAAALENIADSAARAKIEDYRAQGLTLQYEAAVDDAAADYAGQLMENGEVLDQFIERHRSDRTLLEKLRDAFRGLIDKLTGAERRRAQTAEGKLSAALDAAAEQVNSLSQASPDSSLREGAEGQARYSLKSFEDGKRFVDVETDQAQFDGLSEREQGRLATKIIKEKFMGKVIGLENRAYVNSRTAGEYGFPLNHLNADQHGAKMRASTELDNLMDAGTNFRTAPDGRDGHTHPDATGGFQYFDTTFKVGDQYYTGVINIMQTDHGLVLKDVTKIRNITQDISGSYGDKPQATFLRDTSMDSIPQSGEDVNEKYSLKGGTITKSYNRLLKENDLLRERVDYWRGQTRRTREATTDKKAVTAAAKALVKEYGADLDTGELAGRLQNLYDGMLRGLATEESFTQAREIAQDIAGGAVAEWSLAQEFPGLKDRLRTTPITFGHEYDGDIRNENFRKDYRGKLKLSANGPTNVDAVYDELAESYPGLFPADITHPADQLEQIMSVADELGRVEQQSRFSGMMEEAVAGITNEIVEQFGELPQTRPTFADRQAEKLDKLREENRQAVQRAIARERTAREKQVTALKDKYKARTEQGRERQRAGELRQKITRHTKRLSDKLLKPTDKAHIPEELRGPVAKVLESINLESQYTLDPETGKRVKNGDGDPVKRTQAFLELKQKYAEINENGGDIIIDPTLLGSDKGSFDAVIAMGDTPLAAMNSKQLATVWQVVKAVEHSVSTAGKLLARGKYERTSQWADALVNDTSTRRNKRAKTGLSNSLKNPYTFFSQYGQAGKDLYRALRDAQDRQQVLTNQVAEAAEKVVGADLTGSTPTEGKDAKGARQRAEKRVKGLEKTAHQFTTEGGQALTLSTAQVMELYELSKREQARDHLLIGGIVQPEVKSAKVRRGTEAIRLTVNDLADITGKLSAEEKTIADGLQRIAATLLSDMGNEASMAAYGYKKFTEPNYWPIRSAREWLHSNIEKGGDNTRSIKNIGMAQATVPHANNQVDIGSIFDTFARHTGDMVDYAAWLVPMEDLNRVYNYQYRDGEGNPTGRTVKGLLDEKGGEGSQAYWHNLMEDIQNGIKAKNDDPLVNFASKGIGAFKGAAVGGNIRVIIQQPTAFVRANAVLNPADLTRGLAGGATRGSGWKKALQYSPIAMRKDAGGFDISAPGTMKETLFGKTGAVDKVNDALSWGAGAADAWTWGKLWNACEWQVARQHKELAKGSDAFYQEVNRVFTDMIDQTQVVDGILQRSNIMRTSNAMGQQATSFMGEPIMSLNMTMRAWDQLRNEQDPKRRGKAIRNLGRTATALVVTAAVNAAAQSLIDALRDDDRDKKYWERFQSAFTGLEGDEESAWEKAWAAVMEGNLGSNLNPAGQIPYVKDIQSLIQGYDVSRTELSVIQDLIENGQNFIKSADGHGAKTQGYALNKLIASAAKVFGIPAANLERDLWAGLRSVAIETGNIPAQYEMEKAIYNTGSDKNKSRFTDLLYRALEAGELDTYWTIRDELMNKMGVDGMELDSAMKSRYKDRLGKDPAYSIPQEAYDLMGIRPELPGGEKEEKFSAEDLDNKAYQAYSTQRAYDFRQSETALKNNPMFKGMDETTRDKVIQAAYDLANAGALVDASGGQYQPDQEWIAFAPEAEKEGIEPWEYALWHTAYSGAESDKGPDGKDLKGETKKDHVMDWLWESGLSEEQQEFLWGTAYTTDFGEYEDYLTEYRSYGPQKDAAYEEITGGLEDNPIFEGMDAETREKVMKAAMTAATQTAKAEVLEGYEFETQWIAEAGEAAEQGIDMDDYILWHVVEGSTYNDKDANGNDIAGRAKRDKLREWMRNNNSLTYEQKYWLWRQEYKKEPMF